MSNCQPLIAQAVKGMPCPRTSFGVAAVPGYYNHAAPPTFFWLGERATPPSDMRITRSSIAQAAMQLLAIICVAILAVMEGVWVASPANSATIIVNAPDAYGRTFVDIVGEIAANDDAAFQKKVTDLQAHADKVIVTLSGPGGVALTAMKIGELIHKNGWGTYVPSGTLCTSSCSIIWLAGMPRTIEGAPAVIIGFHAIYNKETERESGAGNAILGHYLTRWGLNEVGV
jgi:hypothetical protein